MKQFPIESELGDSKLFIKRKRKVLNLSEKAEKQVISSWAQVIRFAKKCVEESVANGISSNLLNSDARENKKFPIFSKRLEVKNKC